MNVYYVKLIKKIKKLNNRRLAGLRLYKKAGRVFVRNQSKKLAESAVFLKRFVRQPRQVGSVVPSSPFLTKAMMSKIEWADACCVAELGAGTGVFTRAITSKLKPDGKLFVFEIDPALKSIIETEHPNLAVYGDATELQRIIGRHGVSQLDYVVSSLPFAVLPPRATALILDAVDKCLKPGGKLIAYQYSKHMRNYFEKRFESVTTSFVLCNVPPAFVYECTKKGCAEN
ncbi:MAG: methyltransferase type 11 [Synergistaceae bacterium]|nr:methyltransferase type 11 [Synergistaceae bacterium]